MRTSSKAEDRAAAPAALTPTGMLEAIGDGRWFRQHFQARDGSLIEMDGILTTHEEIERVPQRNQPRWAQITLGPLVLMLRMTDDGPD